MADRIEYGSSAKLDHGGEVRFVWQCHTAQCSYVFFFIAINILAYKYWVDDPTHMHREAATKLLQGLNHQKAFSELSGPGRLPTYQKPSNASPPSAPDTSNQDAADDGDNSANPHNPRNGRGRGRGRGAGRGDASNRVPRVKILVIIRELRDICAIL